MAKAVRWLRAFFGVKKSSEEKKRVGSVRSSNPNDRTNIVVGGTLTEAPTSSPYAEAVDANKHAIAVAAATAAVAEAALAAAQAAAEVVRLTSGGGRGFAGSYCSSGSEHQRESAAVKIQSGFRAYLARRALRALKGLVKLQALVRGRIVRKQAADMLRRMQAMARVQARACANRASRLDSPHSSSRSSQSHYPGLATPRIFEHQPRPYGTKLDGLLFRRSSSSKSDIKDNVGLDKIHAGSNWLDHWMEENSWNSHRDGLIKNGRADDEKSDKILEVDTWNPHPNPDQTFRRTSQPVSAWDHNVPSFRPFDSLWRHTTKSFLKVDQAATGTTENSPQMHSVSSRPGSSHRRGPFTPTRSECSRSFFGNYMGHPNYMANTESSRAKVRSQSAPRQRMLFEKSDSTKSFVRGFWDEDTFSETGSTMHANFNSKAYPASARGDPTSYSSTYTNRR